MSIFKVKIVSSNELREIMRNSLFVQMGVFLEGNLHLNSVVEKEKAVLVFGPLFRFLGF